MTELLLKSENALRQPEKDRDLYTPAYKFNIHSKKQPEIILMKLLVHGTIK